MELTTLWRKSKEVFLSSFFFWLLLSIQHVACNASHEGKDKTMGSTWSEILPAVAKQHPPPTSPSAPLVSWKNAHSTQLAGRKLINFSQDLPPCVRTHTHTHTLPPSPLLSHTHTHTMKILVNESMRGCQCLRSTVLIYALSSWAKNKDHTECCATESCKTEMKVTSLVLSRPSHEVPPSTPHRRLSVFFLHVCF